MNNFFLITATLFTLAFAGEDTCNSFGDWRDWTDKCLWFPLSNVRTDLAEACDVIVNNVENLPTFPALPDGFPTEPCGHCGFKARCRKREQKDGCSSIDLEHQHCDDGDAGAVCNLPKIVDRDYILGCEYAMLPPLLQQCVNRPGIPEWKRDQVKRMSSILPQLYCTESGDDQCKCCCHPYVLNADKTECVLREVSEQEAECQPFSEWNDWTEKCLSFPLQQMEEDLGVGEIQFYTEHCHIYLPTDWEHPAMKRFVAKFKLPDSGCGMCAFKLKCRGRYASSNCIPSEYDKKACGNEECEGCGDICQMPKIDGTDCNYSEQILPYLLSPIKSQLQNTTAHMSPEWQYSLKFLVGFPHGRCVEKDDQCMCCCHPYEPNEDGTQCVVKNMCLTAEEAGVTFDMNLPEDSLWL